MVLPHLTLKQPTFNFSGEKKPLYCRDCANDKMVDVGHKMCIKCNEKQPKFNYKNEKKPCVAICGGFRHFWS